MANTIWNLASTLFYHAGTLVILALLLSKLGLFRRLVAARKTTLPEKLALSALFGAAGVLGTLLGIPLRGAVVNSRVVGVFVGGLLGGPLVGALSGAIAGIHRYAIDAHGVSSAACMAATFLEGAAAGLLSRSFRRSGRKWLFALAAGALAEALHMGLVAAVAREAPALRALLAQIFLPMILVNAAGIGLVIAIVEDIFRSQERASAQARAELRALQAQIRPHFFLNALNAIRSLTRTDPDRARELLADLGVFFRKTIQPNEATVPLDKEIEHVSVYLDIEKARFGDRLRVDIDIPDSVKPRIPPLILQPIVENAVKHGIQPLDRTGTVSIAARRENGNVRITVHDDGCGIEPGALGGILGPGRNGESIGLANINQRLVSLFGAGHELAIRSSRGEGTTVTMLIPDGQES